MLFDSQLDDPCSHLASTGRLDMVRTIISSFQIAFSEIEFRSAFGTNAINTQAVVLNQRRFVFIYGGLAFHPHIGASALSFALLHEVGHHLAVGCRLPWDPRLACECVADAWALSVGMETLSKATDFRIDFQQTVKDFDRVAHEPARPPQRDEPTCWSMAWSERRKTILAKRATVDLPTCPLAGIILGGFAGTEGRRHGRIAT
jgi:hypothetical protein